LTGIILVYYNVVVSIDYNYIVYQKKKSFKVNVTGLNADSAPIWSSADVKVGKVNEKGKVSTVQYGSTVIRCKVDGKTLEYYLAVSTKTAVKAMRIGYKKIGKKKYSQARRMSKNYYDILQVNRNASPEIIEKAYKTLAKKYHPDLQTEENKRQAEEILKEINEAYEILSVPEKKEKYDAFLLEEEKISQIETITQKTTQQTPSNTILEEELELKQKHLENLRREQELAYQEQVQQARQKAYYDAYIQDLKNRGYKIRYKKTFKSYIKDLMALFLTFLILFLLWQIPFVQNFFMDLIKDNPLFHLTKKRF